MKPNLDYLHDQLFHYESEIELTEDYKIRVKNYKQLPAYLIKTIIENKSLLIKSLLNDKKAKTAGFCVNISGTLYSVCKCSMKSCVILWIEEIRGIWIAQRESFKGNDQTPTYSKMIACNANFDYVLNQAMTYFKKMFI